MSERTKLEVALTLVLGIGLVFLLPTLQLLPATTRAWRRAITLLPSLRGFARAAVKLFPSPLTAVVARRSMATTLISADILLLDCARLC